MKKLVVFITMLVFALSTAVVSAAASADTTEATARTPFRIARVPIIVTSAMTPTDEVLTGLERQIDRATHVPLNGTLGAVEYLDETECGRIYTDIVDGRYGKILRREAPAKLAELMDADLVIIPQLMGYEEYVRPSWHWDRREILHSYAQVRIEGYDRAEGKPFSESVVRTYDDEYSLRGQVERLASDAMTMVLDEARVHERVWRWKEKSASGIVDSATSDGADTSTGATTNNTTTESNTDTTNGADTKNGN